MEMQRIKRGDIVLVQSEWTKNVPYLYLILFSGTFNPWTSAIKLQPNTHEINDLVVSSVNFPNEIQNTYSDGAYVNVFTGITSIRVNNIKRIVCSITKKEYCKIIEGMVAAFTGNYIEKGRYYMPNKMNLSITVPMGDALEQYFNDFQVPQTTVYASQIPQSSADYIQQNYNSRHKSVSDPSKNSEEKSRNNVEKKVNESNVHITDEGWHMPPRKIDGIPSDLLDKIFEECTLNGFLPIYDIYNFLNRGNNDFPSLWELKDLYIDRRNFIIVCTCEIVSIDEIDIFMGDESVVNSKDKMKLPLDQIIFACREILRIYKYEEWKNNE